MTTPPHKAGRYELQDEIGRGAMGVVYKALDPLIGRTVAVKIMRLDDLGGDTPRPELLARFQTETRAAGLLSHPNIVVIYDAGSDGSALQGGDLFYITMEFVLGRSLLALMEERQAFPVPRLLRVMEQACQALDYAHQRNIVHRDIKPANILVGELDNLKITDFGTAKILELGSTETGHIIGTPSYMSPEQVKGRPVDGRADIFSLGVILYELVTGEKPFPGKNVTTVIYKIVNEDPIPPIELDASLHPGLNAVIKKALAKDPDTRYQTCGDLLKALRSYREVAGSQLTATKRVPAAATHVAATASRMTSPRRRSPVPSQPKKSAQLWLALVIFLVLGTAGYFSWIHIHELLQRNGPALKTPPPPQQPAPSPAPAP